MVRFHDVYVGIVADRATLFSFFIHPVTDGAADFHVFRIPCCVRFLCFVKPPAQMVYSEIYQYLYPFSVLLLGCSLISVVLKAMDTERFWYMCMFLDNGLPLLSRSPFLLVTSPVLYTPCLWAGYMPCISFLCNVEHP